MTNPESFIALGGHALAVNRTARRLAQNDWKVGGIWREELNEVVVLDTSPRERFFEWAGDRLIAVGAWLKTRAVQPRYQHA
jgi:hypothetical protein